MRPAPDPDRLVTVVAAELDEWAWLVAFLEECLANSEIETRDDFAHHARHCGLRLADAVSTLDHVAARMRELAESRP